MTTQKEFQELMQEMEESEKLASLGPWFIDGGHVSSHNDIICDYIAAYENREFIAKSRTFIPLAIDRIKRLERALEISTSTIRTLGFGNPSQIGGNPQQLYLESRLKQIQETIWQ